MKNLLLLLRICLKKKIFKTIGMMRFLLTLQKKTRYNFLNDFPDPIIIKKHLECGKKNMDNRLLEMRNGLSFLECLEFCLLQPQFVADWERLSGQKLLSKNWLHQRIDEATGYDQEMIKLFADFVYKTVFLLF